MPRPGRASGPTLIVIRWRDIPAQVNAADGERTARMELHRRFQVGIDRAAVKVGLREMQAYIAEWRRESRSCGPDLDAEVRAEVERLEAEFDRETLNRLIEAGGIDERKAAAGSTTTGPASEDPA